MIPLGTSLPSDIRRRLSNLRKLLGEAEAAPFCSIAFAMLAKPMRTLRKQVTTYRRHRSNRDRPNARRVANRIVLTCQLIVLTHAEAQRLWVFQRQVAAHARFLASQPRTINPSNETPL